MKHFLPNLKRSFYMLALALVAMPNIAKAQWVADPTTDSEGFPYVYLRGKMTEWAANNAYRFSRSGNTYTLEITSSNPVPSGSEFKIADDQWSKVNLGGSTKGVDISYSTVINLTTTNENLVTKEGFSDATITFSYVEGQPQCAVTFDIRDRNGNNPVNGISGSLPVMYINVYGNEEHTYLENEIIDYNLPHKDYFSFAEYWLETNGCTWMEALGAKNVGSREEPLPLEIKARGNWTRIGYSKKPFKIKLGKKQNLLGLTPDKSKHYALLAHADDNLAYLRNFTTFNLGERIGLPWTPGMQPVEVVINGDYRGLYFLTESIRVGDGRIEIEELDDNVSEGPLVSGGYIVELDNYVEDNQIEMEEKSCASSWHYLDRLRVTWDTPEEYSDLQKRFVTEQFEAINNCIGSNSNETWSYLDLDDAVRYYIVREIMSDVEAYHGSTYLYRDRGEGKKWHFSPLWDAGNAFNGDSDNYFYNCDPYGNTWIPSMRENSRFNEKLKRTWLWFMQNEYKGLEEDMEEYISHLKTAVTYDYNRWNGQPTPPGGQPVVDNRDLDKKFASAKDKLNAKIAWLKGQFGDYTSGYYSEPERDTTLAAPLPEYAEIPEIKDPEDSEEDSTVISIFEKVQKGKVEIYNLQGVKITNPVKGQLYIIKEGNNTRKFIAR